MHTVSTSVVSVTPPDGSPLTLRSPSESTPAPAPSSALRRLRGAVALLNRERARAADNRLPLPVRASALAAARTHLQAAFRFTVELSLAGAPEAPRAAAYLGAINRELPLLASDDVPVSFDKDCGVAA